MKEQVVKYLSDYQTEWRKVIPALPNYELDTVDFLSIPGDAPKDFVTDGEYRPGHRTALSTRSCLTLLSLQYLGAGSKDSAPFYFCGLGAKISINIALLLGSA
jgi:hypothetical protein